MTTRPKRPGWNEAAIWMGAGLPALLSLFRRHGWAIERGHRLDSIIDLGFAAANSTLGGIVELLTANRSARVDITSPLFILGHWRTGTTWLHELLNCDPRLRCPTTYECFVPHHFLATRRWAQRWANFAIPRTRTVDQVDVGWNQPQEDEFALLNLGIPSPYARIAFPQQAERDLDWLDLDQLSAADQQRWRAACLWFYRRLLAANPGQLCLKSPPHTCRLPTLMSLFPTSRFVYLVRDPNAVVPSTIRLWSTLSHVYGYQQVDELRLRLEVPRMFTHFHERFEATRHLIPADRLLVLRYEELVADPLSQLQKLYDSLSLGDFSQVREIVTRLLRRRASYRGNQHALDEQLREAITECSPGYRACHGYST